MDKPFHKTEWQSFVGTSHFCLAKNESNFIFSVKTQTVNTNGAPTDGIHSTHNTPSESQGAARQSFVFTSAAQTKAGWYSRRRAEPPGKDKPFRWSSTTLNLGLRNQAYLYPSLYIGSIFSSSNQIGGVWSFPLQYIRWCYYF